MNVDKSKKIFKFELITFSVVTVSLILFYFLMNLNNASNRYTFFYKNYFLLIGIFLFLILLFFIICFVKTKKQKKNPIFTIVLFFENYGFLLKQLVSRDFKSKYKRSALGILWSLLNPMLISGIQYIIFSTLFGNDSIKNYPVYLIIGVIFFTFITESASNGLCAITGNSNLLNKISVPKSVFVLSKVLSTSINFFFSIIPLIIIMAICHITISPAQLLIVFLFGLVFLFTYGLALFLSTCMVFFRDTQFLWGIITMVWMYATPIFYDLNFIKSDAVKTVIKFNPLYHYLSFARSCLSDGACPDLMNFVYCISFSLIMLLIGVITFNKKKDDFVLYL